MFKKLIVFAVLWTVAVSFSFEPEQGIPSDNTVAMIRANYLYQFASNNNWPNDTKTGKFMVGILGDQDVFEIMAEKYGTKPIGSQVIEVVSLTEIPSNQFLHMVFIDKSKKSELSKCARLQKDKSTLIVTNWDGALAQGSYINFKNIDGTIRFEINKKALEEKRITPGVKIIQWALQ